MVAWAADEEAAVTAISGTHPDAVILDLNLNEGTGLGVLRRIRAEGSSARVLVLSNFSHQAMKEACFEAGADAFYDKHTQVDACIDAVVTCPQTNVEPGDAAPVA